MDGTMEVMAQIRAVFQVCLAVSVMWLDPSTALGATDVGGVPRRLIPVRGTDT